MIAAGGLTNLPGSDAPSTISASKAPGKSFGALVVVLT
jgi:hypothetical protein